VESHQPLDSWSRQPLCPAQLVQLETFLAQPATFLAHRPETFPVHRLAAAFPVGLATLRLPVAERARLDSRAHPVALKAARWAAALVASEQTQRGRRH
jgi:hypothetical protein